VLSATATATNNTWLRAVRITTVAVAVADKDHVNGGDTEIGAW
jgi:hypothetical protein